MNPVKLKTLATCLDDESVFLFSPLFPDFFSLFELKQGFDRFMVRFMDDEKKCFYRCFLICYFEPELHTDQCFYPVTSRYLIWKSEGTSCFFQQVTNGTNHCSNHKGINLLHLSFTERKCVFSTETCSDLIMKHIIKRVKKYPMSI